MTRVHAAQRMRRLGGAVSMSLLV
ncbi:MAG: hypothetical protein QOE93_493, partial [Actinomycetota bacterium]|nr:hypothetical protein [Actinomycetota bacterium]